MLSVHCAKASVSHLPSLEPKMQFVKYDTAQCGLRRRDKGGELMLYLMLPTAESVHFTRSADREKPVRDLSALSSAPSQKTRAAQRVAHQAWKLVDS
jgi:hypothetical protein